MGRHSCCTKQKLRKGLWSPEEDEKLYNYITRFGIGCWSSVPKLAGLQRCGKSCRLRWINYLRPDLKRGMFSQEEEDVIIRLHHLLGNRWAQIAAQLPGRTDNEIKNFWNSSIKKKLIKKGIDPQTHEFIYTQVKTNNNNDRLLKSFSEPQNNAGATTVTTTTIKLEQPCGLNNSADNCSSIFSNAVLSSLNSQSQISFEEASAGGCQSYQNLILSECRRQMSVFRPTAEVESEQYSMHSCISEPMLQNFDEITRERAHLGETGADCFSESLMFSEGKECSSSSSNNNNNNNIMNTSNASFSWENNSETNFDSEIFQCPFNYELIKMEISHDQPTSWEEQHLKSLSLSEDLAAATGGNLDAFLHH